MKSNFTKRMLLIICMMSATFFMNAQTVHEVSNTAPDVLKTFIEDTTQWEAGDVIKLTGDSYTETTSIEIYQSVTIMGDAALPEKPMVTFQDNGFRASNDSINIKIQGVHFIGKTNDGTDDHFAPFILRFTGGDPEGHYEYVILEDVEAEGFRGGVDLNDRKQRWYKKVEINNVFFKEFTGQEWVLDPNLNVVKDLKITNSTFVEVGAFLKNVYFNKDGAEIFGDVQQHLLVDHCTFFKIGDYHNSLIQLNDQNDAQLDFVFSNNIVSSILNDAVGVNANRLLRLNPLAGTYKFENSVFHDFVAADPAKDEFSLDSIAVDPEYTTAVSVTDVQLSADYPGFADTTNYDFGFPAGSALLTAAKDGGAIGDPRWNGGSGGGPTSDRIHMIPDAPDSLEHFIENTDYWNPGDTIMLSVGAPYIVNGTIDIFQEITVMGDPSLPIKPTLVLYDNGFRAKEDTISITLKGFNVDGWDPVDSANAAYVLRFDQAAFQNYKNILIEDMEAYNTQGGVQLYKNKNTMYESVIINNCYFHDMESQWVLDPFLNAVQELKITNSTFVNIKAFLKNVYNNNDGTNVFGDVQQNITIDHNTFFKVISDILIQTNDSRDGQINFNWTNNIVSTILDSVNTRPFRIEHDEGGTFSFRNSVFHDFTSSRNSGSAAGYNLDSLEVLSNVTIENINTDYPGFADTTEFPYNLTLPLNTPLLSFGTEGGLIGDPRWYPQVGVEIDELTEAIEVGDTVTIGANVTFGEGIDATVAWSVVNGSGTASIDAGTGELIALTEGTISIVATSNFSASYADTLDVTINPKTLVSSITLVGKNEFGTESSAIDRPGGKLTITATVFPANAADRTVTWTLSDETLVTIDESTSNKIVIQGKLSGDLTVTATANDESNISSTFDVVLTKQSPVTAITVTATDDVSEIEVGETLQMIATVEPATADNDSVAWSVDNTSIATINATGVLTAVAAGTVIVKADATDQSFRSGTYSVVVIKPLGLNPVDDLATLYPNPAAKYVFVNIQRPAEVRVMNLSGQKLIDKNLTSSEMLDISSLKAGVYVMTVKSGNDVQSIRFSKK